MRQCIINEIQQKLVGGSKYIHRSGEGVFVPVTFDRVSSTRVNEDGTPVAENWDKATTYRIAEAKATVLNNTIFNKFGVRANLTSYADGTYISFNVPYKLITAYHYLYELQGGRLINRGDLTLDDFLEKATIDPRFNYPIPESEKDEAIESFRQEVLKEEMVDRDLESNTFVGDAGTVYSTQDEASVETYIPRPLEPKKDPNVREKYFPTEETTTNDVIDKISESNHPLAPVAKALKQYIPNIPIRIVNKSVTINGTVYSSATTSGLFVSSNTPYILIWEDAAFRGLGSEPTILHEMLHAATHYKLKVGGIAVERFGELFQHAKKEFPREYATKNEDEFLVALFTDGTFIKKLKTIPAVDSVRNQNFLQEIFDYILSLFDVNSYDSLYSQAFAVATNILESDVTTEESPLEVLEDVSGIKPGVEELFNENESLANEVYEAVGITQETTQQSNNTVKEVVQDLSGSTYSVNKSDITTYETEYGPIRYIINENGDMVMLSNKNMDAVEDQITPQQKATAQQVYQSFLDVYLQDFEQVERVLKEEKIIDKKCS